MKSKHWTVSPNLHILILQEHQKSTKYLQKEPVTKGGLCVGPKVLQPNVDPIATIIFPIQGRYPLHASTADDCQCAHEIAHDDGRMRYWCDATYRSKFGKYVYHVK